MGWRADISQRRMAATGIKGDWSRTKSKDLFGLFDIVAFQLGAVPNVLGVQTTTLAQIINHVRKYRRDPELRSLAAEWIECGRGFLVHGWEERWVAKKTGAGLKRVWHCEEVWVTMDMLALTKTDLRVIFL